MMRIDASGTQPETSTCGAACLMIQNRLWVEQIPLRDTDRLIRTALDEMTAEGMTWSFSCPAITEAGVVSFIGTMIVAVQDWRVERLGYAQDTAAGHVVISLLYPREDEARWDRDCKRLKRLWGIPASL